MPLCPSTTYLLPDRNYIVIANAAARPTGGSLFTGLMVFQVDVGAAFRWNGSIWQRIGEYGFSVSRSTNAAAIANVGQADITFDTLQRNTGFLSGTFAATSTFTVPSDGAGVYALYAAAFWATNSVSVYVSVTVNATISAATNDAVQLSADRHVVSGLYPLAAGDVVRLHIYNGSGASITPTAYAGDANTPRQLTLSVWRLGD